MRELWESLLEGAGGGREFPSQAACIGTLQERLLRSNGALCCQARPGVSFPVLVSPLELCGQAKGCVTQVLLGIVLKARMCAAQFTRRRAVLALSKASTVSAFIAIAWSICD